MPWRLRIEFPQLMGILNVTPDSFSDGGRYADPQAAVAHALEMELQGAHVIDMGAESTRPKSTPVPPAEQLRRLLPVLKSFRKQSKLPVSIDTWSADVAEACLDAGANIINDISALRGDKRIVEVARRYPRCAIVLMHATGIPPKNMHKLSPSKDIVATLLRFFKQRLDACEAAGIAAKRCILDPGIGFGKTADQNLTILKELQALKSFDLPLLVGVSRKRFLGTLTNNEIPEQRDLASVTAAVYAVDHGADMLRIHNIKAHIEAAVVMGAIVTAGKTQKR